SASLSAGSFFFTSPFWATSVLVASAPMRSPPPSLSMCVSARRPTSTTRAGWSTSSFIKSTSEVPPARKAVSGTDPARRASSMPEARWKWIRRMVNSSQRRRLHRVEILAAREALDGRDLAPLVLDGEREAGVDALAVHQHGAGAALAHVAALLGA